MSYIGIFDSGVGGLGIFQEIKKLLPYENIIYLADTKNCPYGEKSIQQIKQISLDNTKFLIDKGAKIVVIACNTGSTVALKYVRSRINQHTPRKCMLRVPVVGVVPVVKTAAQITKNKIIGILATKRTIESRYLRNLVEQFCPSADGFRIYYQAANRLVGLVERNDFSHPERSEGSQCKKTRFFADAQNDTKEYLKEFIKNKVDVVALSCTHFTFLRKGIEQILGPSVKVLDSNGAVARQVKRVLSNNFQLSNNQKKAKYIFYSSKKPDPFRKQLLCLLGIKAKVKLLTI